jgi:DNA-binding NarL/FixJ family response regulator
MSSKTVYIADAQPPFRAGLRSVLEMAGLEVVGEAEHASDAIAAIARLRPDICVIAAAGDGIGISAIRRITHNLDSTHVLVLASAPSHDGLIAALRAGASGYLPRNTGGAGFVRAVRSVLAGEFAITRASIGALVTEVRAGAGRQRLLVGGIPVSLTEREAQVLELLVAELGTQEIADELGVSPVTVRRHLGSVAAKLGKQGREQLLSAVRAA